MTAFRLILPIALAALAAVFLTACQQETPQPPAQQTVIEYREPKRAEVSGEIAVPNGMNAAGVQIFVAGRSYSAFTDSQGSFILSGLPEGEFEIMAMRADLETAILGTVTVTQPDLDKQQPFHTLQRYLMDANESFAITRSGLTAGALTGRIEGMVETLFPSDAAGVSVQINGTAYRAATFADGRYEFPAVETGSYTLLFEKEGFISQTADVSVRANRTTTVPPVELRPEGGAAQANRTIYGTLDVLMEDGSLPSDYSIFRVVLEGTSYTATPDSSGNFEIRNVPADIYTVSANAPGYLLEEKATADVRNISATEVILTLLEDTTDQFMTGSIEGQVTLQDPPDAGNAGIAVSLIGTQSIAFTDSQGNYRLEGVEPGVYDLMATMTGWESGVVTGLSVAGGETTRAEELVLTKEFDRPYVVATEPADGARDIAIEQPTIVLVQFSQRMNIASVRNATRIIPEIAYQLTPVRERGAGAQAFALELNAIPENGRKALRFNERYRIQIDESAENLEGVRMESSYEMSFSTGSPLVIATIPQDGESNFVFRFEQPISIFFNAAIDRETIEIDDFDFRPALPSGKPQLFFRRDDQTGWTEVQLQGSADFGEDYRLTIGRGARTLGGDRVRNLPYTIEFTTREHQSFEDRYGIGDLDYDPEQRERDRN